MEKKNRNRGLKYCEALKKITKEIPPIIQKEMTEAGIYIGKTIDIEKRAKEHKREHGYVYLTPIAQGDSTLIPKLEEEVIGVLKNTNLKVLNDSDFSTGNKEANVLYICFDLCHPNDEMCEWDLFPFGDDYPILIV